MNCVRASVLVLLLVACLLISDMEARKNRGRSRHTRRSRQSRRGNQDVSDDTREGDHPICFNLTSSGAKVKLFQQNGLLFQYGLTDNMNTDGESSTNIRFHVKLDGKTSDIMAHLSEILSAMCLSMRQDSEHPLINELENCIIPELCQL